MNMARSKSSFSSALMRLENEAEYKTTFSSKDKTSLTNKLKNSHICIEREDDIKIVRNASTRFSETLNYKSYPLVFCLFTNGPTVLENISKMLKRYVRKNKSPQIQSLLPHLNHCIQIEFQPCLHYQQFTWRCSHVGFPLFRENIAS